MTGGYLVNDLQQKIPVEYIDSESYYFSIIYGNSSLTYVYNGSNSSGDISYNIWILYTKVEN